MTIKACVLVGMSVLAVQSTGAQGGAAQTSPVQPAPVQVTLTKL